MIDLHDVIDADDVRVTESPCRHRLLVEASLVLGEVLRRKTEIGPDRLDGDEPVELFPDAERLALTVVNRGDRDIQVRSQSHFFETNLALEFDRRAAWGHKLDVASGAGVRFEPGIPVEVKLVPMAGDRVAQGFSGVVNGSLDADGALDAALAAQHEG